MEELATLLEKAVAPFLYPFSPGQRIYFLYLATALALAFIAYNTPAARRGRASLTGFLHACFPKQVYGHRSAWVDYKFFVVNRIAYPLLFAPLIVSTAAATGWTGDLLVQFWGPSEGVFAGGGGASILLTLVVVLATDAGVFVAHYLQHKVPVLWEFHKVHHSAEVLTPITVYRMHPVDNLLTGTMSGFFSGVVYGVFAYLHADTPGIFVAFGLNIGVFVFYLAGYNLRHTHIWLAYPRPVSHILVSPAQHQIHHSRDPKHFDKNLGFIFAFWDWLAGTLYVPQGKEELRYGLGGDEHLEFDGVWTLYLLPVRKLLSRLRRPRRVVP